MFKKFKEKRRYKRLMLARQRVLMCFDGFRRRRNIKILHCFGDSHLKMFVDLGNAGILRKTAIRTTIAFGGTASGLGNSNSKSNVAGKFRANLVNINQEDYYLFLLGEVDCGSLIWYRADKHNESISINLERSIDSYRNFVLSLNIQDKSHIILCSAPLPTIADGQTWGEVANIRSEITATLAQRTQLTRQYNRQLWMFCQQHGMQFLDMESETINLETGVVNQKFLNSDPLDHHLDSQSLLPILVAKLRNMNFH